MIVPLLCVFLIFIFLCVSEMLWRRKVIRDEAGRKLVHIIIGTFVATWPLFMPFEAIHLISIGFLVIVLVSRRFHIFDVIHRVKRKTWGDILFAISIGLLPFLSNSRLVFTAAVLHMSLADGLAGLIGSRYGKSTRFSMFSHPKSVVGSLTFLVISYAIVLGFFKASRIAGLQDINGVVVILPVVATLLETASVKGSDNILVPLLVSAVLNSTLS